MAVVVLAVAGVAAADEGDDGARFARETVVFGTRVSLVVRGVPSATAAAASDEVFALFADMHDRFYPWRAGELQTLNTALRREQFLITLTPMIAELLTLSIDYSRRSEELFNPAIADLLNLWGFFRDPPPTRPPPAADLASWRANAPSMLALRIDGQQLTAATRYHQFDFGAIGKGYALDLARRILQRHGVRNALINIGGSIAALGTNGTRHWQVALSLGGGQTPLAVVRLHSGEAVATSGDGEQYFIYNGTRYHHIMDPRSGLPARHRHTAIVISAGRWAGAVSDAAATALVIANNDEAHRIANNFGVDKIWRINDNDSTKTPAMSRRIVRAF